LIIESRISQSVNSKITNQLIVTETVLSRPDLATGSHFASLLAKCEPPVGGLSQPRRDTADPEIFSTPCDGAIFQFQKYS